MVRKQRKPNRLETPKVQYWTELKPVTKADIKKWYKLVTGKDFIETKKNTDTSNKHE